jgi:uncharacterized membrane protein
MEGELLSMRHLYRAFPNREAAETVALGLRQGGVDPDRITIVTTQPEPIGHREDDATKTEETLEAAREDNLSVPLGAATAVGGAVAVAAGVAAGAGALLVAGPLLMLMAPAGALGATLGGFVGYLVGKGIPKEDLEQLEQTLQNNGAVLVVDSTSSDEQDNVTRLIDALRTQDVAAPSDLKVREVIG